MLKDRLTHFVSVVSIGNNDRGERVRVLSWVLAQNFKSPGANCATRGFRQPCMACEDSRQTFFVKHRNCFA